MCGSRSTATSMTSCLLVLPGASAARSAKAWDSADGHVARTQAHAHWDHVGSPVWFT